MGQVWVWVMGVLLVLKPDPERGKLPRPPGRPVVFLNYLWPLWDSKRQTVADKIAKAIVVRVNDATT
jgi:uncharacterized RDD family membrane protein YckC